ncbi:MAG: hypothetical protein JRD88_05625 [Deltaproteobacteria bacterium]|nr:hypothetical protein [Deltaproteobacteria bacterium]
MAKLRSQAGWTLREATAAICSMAAVAFYASANQTGALWSPPFIILRLFRASCLEERQIDDRSRTSGISLAPVFGAPYFAITN